MFNLVHESQILSCINYYTGKQQYKYVILIIVCLSLSSIYVAIVFLLKEKNMFFIKL